MLVRRSVAAVVLVASLLSLGLVACSDDEPEEVDSEATTIDETTVPEDTTAPEETTVVDETSVPPESMDTSVPDTMAPPSTETLPPDLLGTPSEFGMEYPAGTTCEEAEALFASVAQETAIALAEGDGTWIWLAVDEPSISADLFSITEPDRIIVRIRGGALDYNAEATLEELPALAGDVSYATLTSDTENGITDCVDGPVAD